ncbi:MAG: DUF4430 domain-containing protein [Actinomycetia bacterium]|nr:DUF4430 domain-containing protein [Actinomycetes bacterium]
MSKVSQVARQFSKTLVVALLILSTVGIALLVGCTTNGGGSTDNGSTSGNVTIKIDITAAVEAGDATAMSLATRYGGNVFTCTVNVADNTTVLVATKAATVLTVSTVSSSYGDYVDSIDGLASGAVNSTAGWTFDINGTASQVGADVATVKTGDTITWTYVTVWQ